MEKFLDPFGRAARTGSLLEMMENWTEITNALACPGPPLEHEVTKEME